jgi:hypothetical protein
VALLILVPAALVGGGALLLTPSNGASRTPLRLTRLHGALAHRHGLIWVELTATLCAPSPLKSVPSAEIITHYEVRKSHWWPARTTIDHAPWLVSLGENWGGKHCGLFEAEDPIPPWHYGIESLGVPSACYGVSLTVVVDGARASRRAIVTCGSKNP